jgi:hypothetical protein
MSPSRETGVRSIISAMSSRAVVIAILIYISLDLSLAALPGAFVFDAADSVESPKNRGRASTEAIAGSALRKHAPVLPVPDRLADRGEIPMPSNEPRWQPSVRPLPRSVDDKARLSEDPH